MLGELYDYYNELFNDNIDEAYFYFLYYLCKGQIEKYLLYEIANELEFLEPRAKAPLMYMINKLYHQRAIIDNILADESNGIHDGIKQFTEGSRSLTYDSNVYNAIFNSGEVDISIPKSIKQMLPLPRVRFR